MKQFVLIGAIVISMFGQGIAQVAINTDGSIPDNSAILDVKSAVKGLLLPRMTQAQRDAIVSPANGLLIFQTDNVKGCYYNSGSTSTPLWLLVGDGNLTLPYIGSVAAPGNIGFSITNSSYHAIQGFSSATAGLTFGVWGISASNNGTGVYGRASSLTGTTTGVEGESYSPDGYGVRGFATSYSGANFGIYGESNSPAGTGVYGLADNVSGVTYGLYGESNSTTGYGVYGLAPTTAIKGQATAGSGAASGVYGESTSTAGRGVTGKDVSSSGTNYGVYGESSSTDGLGVYGLASSATGDCFGMRGQSNSTTGYGVVGHAASTTGINYGVKGQSMSSSGYGVHGMAYSAAGTTYGVFGQATSSGGFGVYGKAPTIAIKGESTGSSGITYGISGESESTSGRGVYGLASSLTGITYGVYGESTSAFGRGVYGKGDDYGVMGEASGSTGIGVSGQANSTTGNAKGVYGYVLSASGYSGYFTGGMFYVESDVGIFKLPDYRLDVAGTANLNGGITSGVALRCNGDETIWYNGTYFSWGYGGTYNYFGDEVSIGTSAVPGYTLVVNGSAAKTGGGVWSTLSDARLKNLSGSYDKGLDEIVALRPVRFYYKEGNPRDLASDEEQIGFIAQEVQVVFPEAVKQCRDGYLDFNMHPINVALVNAVKELKAENDRLKAENEKIEARLAKLESLMSLRAEK